MKISQVMKRDVISIPASASIGEAEALFINHHIGVLPVVDTSSQLVGLLLLSDVLNLVLPDFMRLMEDFDFVHDFGAVEARRLSLETMARPVNRVMQPPVCVEETSGLLRTFALLYHHRLSDVPVVTTGKRLVGIASRVDVGTALLASWQSSTSRAEGKEMKKP